MKKLLNIFNIPKLHINISRLRKRLTKVTQERNEFETAKLAKEKGFDVPCVHYWSIHHAGVKRPVLAPSFSGSNQNYNGYDFTKGAHSAPTQSLLQKWLREEHKIKVYALLVVISGYSRIKHKWKTNLHKKGVCNNNYEEALEKGLIESLKLIEL